MRKHTTCIKDLPPFYDEDLWKSFKEGNKDVIQDLFLKLWNTRNKLGDCNNIRYYLLQSVRRLIIDQYQKKKKPFTTEIDENLLPAELPFESVLISNQEQSQRTQELKKAFSSLSKRQQEAIYLRYYQQFDFPAIAEIMGVNIQSVRNLIHTAIQQLKLQLGNLVILFLSFLKKVEKR